MATLGHVRFSTLPRVILARLELLAPTNFMQTSYFASHFIVALWQPSVTYGLVRFLGLSLRALNCSHLRILRTPDKGSRGIVPCGIQRQSLWWGSGAKPHKRTPKSKTQFCAHFAVRRTNGPKKAKRSFASISPLGEQTDPRKQNGSFASTSPLGEQRFKIVYKILK